VLYWRTVTGEGVALVSETHGRVRPVGVKATRPDLYAAFLLLVSNEDSVAPVLDGALDALHPFFAISAELTETVLDSGAQVNMWTVNGVDFMNLSLDKGATAIITDEPGLLVEVIAERVSGEPT